MIRTKKECPDCGRKISASNLQRHVGSKVCIKSQRPEGVRDCDKYEKVGDMYKCPHCDKLCPPLGIGVHVWKHSEKGRKHTKLLHIGDRWNKGLTSGTDDRVKRNGEEISKSLSENHPWQGRKHTEETKQKVSAARKKWLSENPDKHPWKRPDKFISVPCEKLKEDLLSAGLLFEEELPPLTNRGFSIDIAFPDIMLAIEVNGNFHYTDHNEEILAPYYQERHDLISDAGWEVWEIRYTKCYDEIFVQDLIAKIKKRLCSKNIAS